LGGTVLLQLNEKLTSLKNASDLMVILFATKQKMPCVLGSISGIKPI
jgi:hypothetical protein